MGCLTTIYPDLCTDGGSTGGVDEIQLLDGQEFDQTGTTIGADGEITAITLDASATVGFLKMDFLNEGAQFINTGTVTAGNIVEIGVMTITIPKKDTLKYNFLRSAAACNCGLILYYKDLNGVQYLSGTEGEKQRVYVTEYIADTGLAFEDPNQYTVTLTCRGKFAERVFDGTLPTV